MILRRHVPQACPYRHVRANQPRIHRAPECGEAAVGDLSRVQVESESFSRLGWVARVPIRSPFIKGNQGSCCVLSVRAGVRRRRTAAPGVVLTSPYLVIRLGELGSLAGKVSSTAWSTS